MKEKAFPYPEYKNLHYWEVYHSQLKTEYKQCIEEGKALDGYKQVFEAIQDMPFCPEKNRIGRRLV